MRGAWWWIDAWRGSPAFVDLNAEEQGLYRNLCDEIWIRDGNVIPDESLARASGDPVAWARCSEKVLRYMLRVEAGWTNEKALEVIKESARRAKKQADYRERQRAGGSNPTGNKRRNSPGNKTGSPSPSPSPSPQTTDVPSEQGAGAPVVDDPFSPPPTATANGNARSDWPTRAAAIYLTFYPKGQVPKPMFKALKPLVTKYGLVPVEAELDAYLRGTEVQFHNWSKFAAGFGSWAAPTHALAARGSPAGKGAMARSEEAVMRFIARGGDATGE